MNEITRPTDEYGDGAPGLGSQASENVAADAAQDERRGSGGRASAIDEGKEQLRGFEESLVRTIRKAPVKSLLIAAGAGVLLGVLCRWR